jgi:hypothetical protein
VSDHPAGNDTSAGESPSRKAPCAPVPSTTAEGPAVRCYPAVTHHRAAELEARRDVIHQIQRRLARQQYDALENYGPTLGYDYGGRLLAAWLDR